MFGPPVVFLQGLGAACKKIGCVRLLMYLEDYSLLLLGSRALGAAYAPRKLQLAACKTLEKSIDVAVRCTRAPQRTEGRGSPLVVTGPESKPARTA